MNPKPSLYHFILHEKRKWKDILDGDLPAIDDVKDRIVSGEDIWIVLSYLHLKHNGFNATISNFPAYNRINVIDGVGSGSKHFQSDYFYLTCRNDAHYPSFGQYVLHQNLLSTNKSNELYCPQWPQPGLIPRSTSREDKIKTIAFFGQPKRNLAERFQSGRFMSELDKRNINFIIKGKNASSVDWHDYSEVDLVLAIREIPEEFVRLKPVNKVTNSWLAGTLCITGNEPAAKAAFPGAQMILEANDIDEVLAVIDKLNSNPNQYREYIKKAKELAKNYDESHVLSQWVKIEDMLSSKLSAWSAKSSFQKKASWVSRAAQHRYSKHLHKKRILQHL